MNITEIYDLLFENYEQLEDKFEDIMLSQRGFSNHPVYKKAVRLGISLGFMKENDSLVVAYKNMVRNNVFFSENPRSKDTGYWIKEFSRSSDSTDAILSFVFQVTGSLIENRNRREEKEGKTKYQVIYKDSSWILYRVDHKAAACKLGTGTDWCISARGDRNYFDEYNQQHTVYMIHTKNDKYALIIRDSDNFLTEVQYGTNDYQSIPDSTILHDFSTRLRRDGVDIAKLESILKVKVSVDLPDMLVNFELKLDKKLIGNGKRLFLYTPVYTFFNDGTQRKNVIEANNIPFGEIYYIHERRSIYKWLTDNNNKNALWERAVYNEYTSKKLPVDNAPLNRFITVIRTGFYESSIDAVAKEAPMSEFLEEMNDVIQ